MAAEEAVRNALRRHVRERDGEARHAVDEFWLPRSNARADLAVLGPLLDGYEIKTERDTLRRLPGQAAAYGAVFDRCIAVVAEKHCEQAEALLPQWWGITTVTVNGSISFTVEREAANNPSVEAETLVRLLWRDEAMAALMSLGHTPDIASLRRRLWDELLDVTGLNELRSIVREAIIERDPRQARIPTRRFAVTQPSVAAP
jgi:hypothetical protein